jgi:hypothetical protein
MALERSRQERVGEKSTQRTGALCTAIWRTGFRVAASIMRMDRSEDPVAIKEPSLL